jgi:hypothetical protein
MPEPQAHGVRSANAPGSDLLDDRDETIIQTRPRGGMLVGAGVSVDAVKIRQDPWRQGDEGDEEDGATASMRPPTRTRH